jgi:hypothetical protein
VIGEGESRRGPAVAVSLGLYGRSWYERACMASESASTALERGRTALQRAYNRLVRPHLPYKIGVFNGVPARRVRLLDRTDEFPEYEAALIDAVRATVEPDDSVVVIGGGYGVSSVVAARHAGRDGSVVAFEPTQERFPYIEETAALNRVADRIDARRALVGPDVKLDGDGGGADRVEPTELPDCDVLELDCEGAEADVLRELSIRPRTIVVETHGCFGTPSAETREVLDSLGYEVVDERPDEPERDIHVLVAERRSDRGLGSLLGR